MELRKAELLRVQDDHHGRLRNVDSDLDDGSSHKNRAFTASEGTHDGFFILATVAPRQSCRTNPAQGIVRGEGE